MLNYKSFMIILVFASTIIFGEVPRGSLHRNDMLILDLYIQAKFSEAVVMCANIPVHVGATTETNIFITFNKKWEGTNSFGELGGILGSVGALTKNTNWHSDYLILIYAKKGFQSKMIVCTTRATRYFANNVEKWSNVQAAIWLANNLIIQDE